MDLDKNDKQIQMFSEEIFLDKRYINIKSSIQIGIYARDIFGHLVLSNNRSITKVMMEQSLEQYVSSVKDAFTKTVVNDLINIFLQLNLAKHDTSDSISFIGPESLNQRKITYDQIKNLKEEMLNQTIPQWEKKELLYFNNTLKDLFDKKEKQEQDQKLFSLAQQEVKQEQQSIQINQNNLNNDLRQLMQQQQFLPLNNEKNQNNQQQIQQKGKSNENQDNKNETQHINSNNQNDNYQLQINIQQVPHSHLSYFPKSAFAMLKGKTWSYLIQKLQIIIGKSPSNQSQDNALDQYRWHTDLEIMNSKRVSRQHAIILYNFTKEIWEIKCLSKKFIIKINNGLYNYKDKPIPLKNKSLITIGGEHFRFFLPNTKQQNDVKEEDKKEEEEDMSMVEEQEEQAKMKGKNTSNLEEEDEEDDDEEIDNQSQQQQ